MGKGEVSIKTPNRKGFYIFYIFFYVFTVIIAYMMNIFKNEFNASNKINKTLLYCSSKNAFKQLINKNYSALHY